MPVRAAVAALSGFVMFGCVPPINGGFAHIGTGGIEGVREVLSPSRGEEPSFSLLSEGVFISCHASGINAIVSSDPGVVNRLLGGDVFRSRSSVKYVAWMENGFTYIVRESVADCDAWDIRKRHNDDGPAEFQLIGGCLSRVSQRNLNPDRLCCIEVLNGLSGDSNVRPQLALSGLLQGFNRTFGSVSQTECRLPENYCVYGYDYSRKRSDMFMVPVDEIRGAGPPIRDRTREEKIKGGAVFWCGLAISLLIAYWATRRH